MSSDKGALHQAKLLQGRLMRLVERRDRQIDKATGAFMIDLLAEVSAEPAWLVNAVTHALRYDKSPRAGYLLDALAEVLKDFPEMKPRQPAAPALELTSEEPRKPYQAPAIESSEPLQMLAQEVERAGRAVGSFVTSPLGYEPEADE